MDIRTLGTPLRTSDFYRNGNGRAATIARENREAMETSRQEEKLSALAQKHLHRLSGINGILARDAIRRREELITQHLAQRELLNC